MSAQRAAKVAVILVAGVGERLRPLTDVRPKALIDVGAETMLSRAIRQLRAHGVEEIVLATGYMHDAVRAATSSVGIRVSYCHNVDFARTQNSVSLWKCAEAVGGRAFYKLDGDVLFEGQVLDRLDASDADLAVATDGRGVLGDEEMKVKLLGDTRWIETFGKALDPAMCGGESIGVERVNERVVDDLFTELERAVERGETNRYYEDFYSMLIADGARAEAVDVGDLRWMEIDTQEDLAKGRALFGDMGDA